MKLSRRAAGPIIALTLATGIGALAGCTRTETLSTATLPTVPASTTPATPVPPTAPVTAAPLTTPPATAAPPTAAPTPAPTPAPTDNAGDEGSEGDDGTAPMTTDAIQAAVDPTNGSQSIEVLTWGDVDGDGDQDAIVQTEFCGASCGHSVDLVLNDDSSPRVAEYSGSEPFAPWYVSGGAAQSAVTSATIDGSMIALVGTGLCGDVPVTETDEPGSCNFTTERTATYEYRDGEIRSVGIDPEPG